MKEKIKEFMKKYLIGVILGVLTVGIIKVTAETFFPSNQVTYDNTESGMTSDNVQTAIDELYNTCFPTKASDTIIENGNLEKDPYECRYFFKGANPNNYITFNGENAGWRIISVECDGTIKIMRIRSIRNDVWDYRGGGGTGVNDWTRPADLNQYLNQTYYNNLNSIAQNQIVTGNFSIGQTSHTENNLQKTVNSENSQKWNGNIALPTVSEYIRTNSNKSRCGSFSLINDNNSSCLSTGWMDNNLWWWTLTPVSDSSCDECVYAVRETGYIFKNSPNDSEVGIRPALYLSSDVKLTGSGTQSDPYVVS